MAGNDGIRTEAAAAHIVANVPTGRPHDTAAAARARFAGRRYDAADAVYVLDERGRFLGLVHMAELLRAPGERTLEALIAPDVGAVPADMDQERVAAFAIRHDLAAVPVVDGAGRFLGAVPPRELITILLHEHIEDLHRMAGIRHERFEARRALEAGVLYRASRRLPWLLVGLAGSAAATFVVSRFEATLRAQVAVAFFVPAIVYLADAIGTQTEAIAVRALSTGGPPFRTAFPREIAAGLLIGACLGGLAFLAILAAFGDPRLAAAVGAAIVAAGTAATALGLAFPWILARLGRDPAFGSGPVATVVQDVLSLLIYFLIVQLVFA